MRRKPPTKRTPVTGLSGHGGGPSEAVERLLSDPLDVRNLLDPLKTPKFNGKVMTVPQFQVLYAAWNWYFVGLRQLLPEEVQDMAAIYCRTDYPTKKALELLNKLDNPRYSVEIGQPLRNLTEQERRRLLDKAHELFEELVNDPEARARSDELRGFKGRLSQMPYTSVNIRLLDGHVLRFAQLYLFYCMGNWLKDNEENDISDSDIREVANDHYQYNMSAGRFSTLLRDLRDPTHPLNPAIKIITMEPRHREHFGNMALELYNDHAGEKGLPTAHLDIPTDEGEPEPTTTTSMETLSLTTTAPSLSVPTARGPSRSAERHTPQSDIDSHYFNEAFHESQSIEASPSPSGTGSKDTSKKGKGRERQSDSPGEQSSGKGKEKRPRRGGKQ